MAGKSFSSICCLIAKLWLSKFRELDVHGIPLFANPVTNIVVLITCSLCSVQNFEMTYDETNKLDLNSIVAKTLTLQRTQQLISYNKTFTW